MLHFKKCIIAARAMHNAMCTMHMHDYLLYAELELVYGIIFKKNL